MRGGGERERMTRTSDRTRLFHALVRRADEDGWIRGASYNDLAESAGLSYSRALALMRKLRQEGLVSRFHVMDGYRCCPNDYRLHPDLLEDAPPTPVIDLAFERQRRRAA
jgi:hypothetical protein